MSPRDGRLRGGGGEFLAPRFGRIGLKVLKLLRPDGSLNGLFWPEAQSVQSYCSAVRFLGGCLKIPLAARYFINRNDPLCDPFDARDHGNALTPDRLISGAFVDIPGEKRREFDDYRPVSETTLRRIFEEKIAADLLLIYPMASGGEKNLADYYGDETFSSDDVQALIVQIISAVFDLYRNGRAHGDIKPENIIVRELPGKNRRGGKIFRLADFGTVHAEDRPTAAGTGTYYNEALYRSVLRKSGSRLEARLFTDCYALLRTVLALALGRAPKESRLFDKKFVPRKWPEIKGLWKQLLDIEHLTIGRIGRIAGENRSFSPPDYDPPFTYYDGFERLFPAAPAAVEFGRLHEQILFSKEFDPLMKIRVWAQFDPDLRKRIPEFYLTPLLEGNGWKIFHAPDDAATGKRPTGFSAVYRPKSLENTVPAPCEKRRLAAYGRKLNVFFGEDPSRTAFLPEKKHILWVDGEMKVLWGLGRPAVRRVDYEIYFDFLAAESPGFSREEFFRLLPVAEEIRRRETGPRRRADADCLSGRDRFRKFILAHEEELSAENWLLLLAVFPELEDRLTAKICRRLLKVFSGPGGLSAAWLFGRKTFREKIRREKLDLDGAHWLALRRHTAAFDRRIDAGTAWEMFAGADCGEREALLASPRFAALIRKRVADDPAGCVRNFLDVRMDEALFLQFFPRRTHGVLDSRAWEKLIGINPGLLRFIPEKMLPRLNKRAWIRILGIAPGLAGTCPQLQSFTSADWVSLLIQQPGLKTFLPPGLGFSPGEMQRLKRKRLFSPDR